MHLFALPVPTIFGFDNWLVEKVRQSICMSIGSQDHIASAATVATVGTAMWHKLLAAETHAAAPALACLGKNLDPIDEHRPTPAYWPEKVKIKRLPCYKGGISGLASNVLSPLATARDSYVVGRDPFSCE